VIITDEELSESKIKAIQLTENIHRADLTGFEKWQACKELLELNPDWQLKDLAEYLHLDPSSVTRLMSPSRCTQVVQDALKEGKISISDCYAMSKLEAKDQFGLLVLKLSGKSRDVLEGVGRRMRRSEFGPDAPPAVRASKIKVPMVDGSAVTVAGEDISLDNAISIMSDALKLMKAAAAKGLNAKTAMAYWKDVAAAG
jgi:ParB family transcriptional regulator, chromosome partitioning protein